MKTESFMTTLTTEKEIFTNKEEIIETLIAAKVKINHTKNITNRNPIAFAKELSKIFQLIMMAKTIEQTKIDLTSTIESLNN